MHRLSSASRNPTGTSKIVQALNNNNQKDQNYKRPTVDRTVHKTACFGNPSPLIFTRSLSSSCPSSREGLASRSFLRHSSGYSLHPEKLRQILKEKYGQELCNYYDSENYKKKALDIMDKETRVINEWPARNMTDIVVTYEHMLNCAQPRQKPKIIIDDYPNEDVDQATQQMERSLVQTLQRRKKKKNVIQKTASEEDQVHNVEQQEARRMKFRKRTTIMPVYLKKIQEKWMLQEKIKKAQKKAEEEEFNTFYNQMLKSREPMNITKSNYKYESQVKMEEDHLPKVNSINYNRIKDAELKRRWMEEMHRRADAIQRNVTVD